MTDMTKHDRETISKISGRVVFAAAVLACLIVMDTGPAWATGSVYLSDKAQTFGACCVLFNATVSISEPATIEPAVVNWDASYAIKVSAVYDVGLSVNGGECQIGVFGPGLLPYTTPAYELYALNAHFQWVILPSDGVLVTGTNTFEVCGGGDGPGTSFETLEDTLSVTLN